MDQKCIAAHSGEEWRCMFAAYSAEHLVTSVFALQSVYDSWQVGNELAGDVTPESVNQYGSILRASVHKSLLSAPSGVAHGAFRKTFFPPPPLRCPSVGRVTPSRSSAARALLDASAEVAPQ